MIACVIALLSLFIDFIGLFENSSSTATSKVSTTKQQYIEESQIGQSLAVAGDANTISITGVPFEVHQQQLEKKEQEIRELLKQNWQRQQVTAATPEPEQPEDIQQQKARQRELEMQLAAVQTKLQDSETSYEQAIMQRQECVFPREVQQQSPYWPKHPAQKH